MSYVAFRTLPTFLIQEVMIFLKRCFQFKQTSATNLQTSSGMYCSQSSSSKVIPLYTMLSGSLSVNISSGRGRTEVFLSWKQPNGLIGTSPTKRYRIQNNQEQCLNWCLCTYSVRVAITYFYQFRRSTNYRGI